jgi:hypothetical protein
MRVVSMKQNAIKSLSKIRGHSNLKPSSKYSKIIEALEHYNIIQEDSHAKVTVKFNNGGILYIEVKDKKVFK